MTIKAYDNQNITLRMTQVEPARHGDEAAWWRPHLEAKSEFYQAVQTSPFQNPRPSCSRNVMPGPGPHVSSWMITPAVGGYSYLSFTCQQVLPLQTISADAPTAKNARAPAPAMAPKRAFLNIVMTVPVPLFFVYAVATPRHQRQSLRTVPPLGFFQKGFSEGSKTDQYLVKDKLRRTANIISVASRGERPV